MKYIKFTALLLGLAALTTACSDNDEPTWNTASDVTVSMAKPTVSFKENRGLVNVGVKVNGEANGMVQVTCTVEEYGETPAMANAHYLLTSQTINIAEGDTEGYFEISLVDDYDINDARYFKMTLESSKGATLAGDLVTIVEIKDNDSNPYEKLAGAWVMNCDDTRTIQIDTFDEGEAGFGESFIVTGFMDGTDVVWNFFYNEASETGSISIPYGQDLYKIDLSAYGYGMPKRAYLAYVNEMDDIDESGEVVLEWSEDFSELKIAKTPYPDNTNFYYFLSVSAGELYWDAVKYVTNFVRK